MKTPKITKKELMAIAPNMKAAEFEEWCESKRIHTSWVDVDNIMDYNDGYYNIEIVEYEMFFSFYNGEFEMMGEMNNF